jgi:hypothetical protein
MEKYKDDLKFQEFLRVHKRNSFEEWNLDSILNVGKEFETQKTNEVENETTSEDDDSTEKVALKETVSDLDYLKAMTVPSEGSDKLDTTKKKKKDKDNNNKVTGEAKEQKERSKKEAKNEHYFEVKLSNLPFKTKKNEVKHFLKPHKPKSIRVPPRVIIIANNQPAIYRESQLPD